MTTSFQQAPPASDGAFCLATLLPARQQEHSMPTQQMNLTPERDAAVLGVPIALGKTPRTAPCRKGLLPDQRARRGLTS